MPTLSVVNFNIVCATLGGFITLFGLVSYLLKEKFYLSEALISLIAGLIFSPHATNFIKPLEYAGGSEENIEIITLYFTRLVLGVQLVLAGVQLPSKYLKKEWKSLALLLGPGMCAMWISTSLLVWGLVPNIGILFALAIGACVTPTDPVLSNSIVKGKFADKNIPRELQKIIIAESGANDGLGYPFLFLPLYLIKYVGEGGAGQTGGAGKAIGYWFGETWGYEICLSVVYGAVVGWIAKGLLHFAEERKYVDRESFLVFAITLALFIVGTAGMFGSDDVLACFIAGNAFTWDDWFRLETLDDSLQPTIDMLLNVAVFAWFGAITPWSQFVHNDIIPIYRLIPLGILVLLFRRLPIVFALHKKIHQIEETRQALFVGFFGPIGVSAIFYLYVSREFLRDITVDGVQRADAARLADAMLIVIWFLAICSIVIHGLSIPLGKLGFYLPRTISAAISTERISSSGVSDGDDEGEEPQPLELRQGIHNAERDGVEHFRSARRMFTSSSSIPNAFRRFGATVRKDVTRETGTFSSAAQTKDVDSLDKTSDAGVAAGGGSSAAVLSSSKMKRGEAPTVGPPRNPRRIGRAIQKQSPAPTPFDSPSHSRVGLAERTIRFPDEEAAAPRTPVRTRSDDED